jgi:hypothetical protein
MSEIITPNWPHDAFGCYQPLPVDTGENNPGAGGLIVRLSGPPDATTPLWYAGAIDESTGNLYVNKDGTVAGWTLVSGDASGVTGVYAWNGSGNMPTATGAAICVGTVGSAVEGEWWKKTTAGASNADWVAI